MRAFSSNGYGYIAASFLFPACESGEEEEEEEEEEAIHSDSKNIQRIQLGFDLMVEILLSHFGCTSSNRLCC